LRQRFWNRAHFGYFFLTWAWIKGKDIKSGGQGLVQSKKLEQEATEKQRELGWPCKKTRNPKHETRNKLEAE
jgi:hypothetical protein